MFSENLGQDERLLYLTRMAKFYPGIFKSSFSEHTYGTNVGVTFECNRMTKIRDVKLARGAIQRQSVRRQFVEHLF